MSSNELREGVRWYAINTKSQQEERAESNLKAWRVETFVPRMRERRRGRVDGEAAYAIKTLFPRYIFARFDANAMLHKVSFTRGVLSVVHFGGLPVPVEDEVMEIMRARAGADGFIKIGEELEPGDRVMIKAGAFENFIGVFERHLAEADRVKILLTTISYQSHITIDRAMVRKLSPNHLSA
jgi:transcriptional antiterminator RfaH